MVPGPVRLHAMGEAFDLACRVLILTDPGAEAGGAHRECHSGLSVWKLSGRRVRSLAS